ncbi:MAG: ShlB/FhaC/HecB family hemolysin secretion/activation protein [Deltaproteobacteria bacterium]|nr:ShlB/FhaC/HecB family hemolysin secretion/activation protein [Deltaproteobacteria bacterium]
MQRLKIQILTILLGCLLFSNPTVFGADVPQVRFTVERFVIEGENPLSENKTQGVLAPFTGEHEGLSRIEKASKALEQALHDKGYQFHRVVVPPQRTADGVIMLRILIFPLDKITVKGNKHFSDENILASIPCLQPGQSPNTLKVARSLLIANEHPAKRVAVFIRESQETGHVNARVEARDMRPYQVFSSYANTGDRATGHTRLSLGFQHSNLFNRDHIMTLSFTTSPGHWSDVQQYGAFYRIPLYGIGAGISMFYSHSKADQGTVADFFDVSGKGDFAGISFDYALRPIGDYSHKVTIGLQDRLFENDTNFSGQPIGVDVRSRPVSLRYNGGLEKAKVSAGFSVEYTNNLVCGGDNDSDAYEATRADADPHWDAFRFGADLDYTLPKNWQLRSRFAGQVANEPLISGEQFGLGGAHSVRGFDEREISGDNGYQFNFEVWTPPIVHNVRLLAFFDTGRRNLDDPHPGQVAGESISSIGMGLRWYWKSYLSISLDAAHVLNGINGDDVTKTGDDKVHFNVFVRF